MFPQGLQALFLRLDGPRNKSGVTLERWGENTATDAPEPGRPGWGAGAQTHIFA
jgi:hypothetical protein